MFVFIWYISRYFLYVSTRWHSYHDYDQKLLFSISVLYISSYIKVNTDNCLSETQFLVSVKKYHICIILCLKKVLLALFLLALVPFCGLDVSFSLSKNLASLILYVFVTESFKESCKNWYSELLFNIIIYLNNYCKKHFHRLVFFRNSS